MQIIDNVYLLDSSKGNYVYIIRDEEIVLVDTGLPFKRKSIIELIYLLGGCARHMENLWRKTAMGIRLLTVAKASDIIVGTSTNSGTTRQMMLLCLGIWRLG